MIYEIEVMLMVNRNDAHDDILLEKVIQHLRHQAIPDFPDPEIAAFQDAMMNASSVPSISPLWRLAMNRRFQLSAGATVGVAVVVGLLLAWGGSVAKPVSAMEQMAQSIRKAKSYKCTQIVQYTKDFSEPGEPPVKEPWTLTVYWLAPGSKDGSWSRRIEVTQKSWQGPGPEFTDIRPAGKPGILIKHEPKAFHRYPTYQKNALSLTSDGLESLGKFSGEADRELGTKQINGKKARGFQIDMKKMGAGPGLAEIWLDSESNLPVLVRYEMKALGGSTTLQTTDIQWNIDLDPKLFDPTPPEGYTDATPKPPALQEQVRLITEALKIYVETSGGHYPREKSVDDHNTVYDLCKMLGVVKWPTREEANAAKVAKAIAGFRQIGEIQVYNPDAAYYETVGPGDKDKVLFRWKLDDGRYEVIFGDLRSQTVTAERLRALEGK